MEKSSENCNGLKPLSRIVQSDSRQGKNPEIYRRKDGFQQIFVIILSIF